MSNSSQWGVEPLIGITSKIELLDSPPCENVSCERSYVKAVSAHGGVPLLLSPGISLEAMRRVLATVDGILIPGGPDVTPSYYHEEPHPKLGSVCAERDSLEITLVRLAREQGVPVLGICRGSQVMNVACGGTLYQDILSQNESFAGHSSELSGALKHSLELTPDSILAKTLGETSIQVNSMHHQAVKDLAPGLVINARATDGVIEGIEGVGGSFFLGVQCHPEILWDSHEPKWSRLFRAFVDACSKRR